MTSGFLLDTHIVVRWLTVPKKLSSDQARAIREAMRRQESVDVSAVTLLELAVLFGQGRTRSDVPASELLRDLEANAAIRILPLTVEVAREVAELGPSLRDPSDRAIVATARVHRLRLITSDERIVDSGLVTVVS